MSLESYLGCSVWKEVVRNGHVETKREKVSAWKRKKYITGVVCGGVMTSA